MRAPPKNRMVLDRNPPDFPPDPPGALLGALLASSPPPPPPGDVVVASMLSASPPPDPAVNCPPDMLSGPLGCICTAGLYGAENRRGRLRMLPCCGSSDPIPVVKTGSSRSWSADIRASGLRTSVAEMNRPTGSETGGLAGMVSGCERMLISMRCRSVSVNGDTPKSISKITQPVLLRGVRGGTKMPRQTDRPLRVSSPLGGGYVGGMI